MCTSLEQFYFVCCVNKHMVNMVISSYITDGNKLPNCGLYGSENT